MSKATLRIVSLISLFFCSSALAVTVHEDYRKIEALLRIGSEPERQIWMTERGHTLILPDNYTHDIIGVAVFFQRGRVAADTSRPEAGTFDAEAFNRRVAVLHIATGDPLDFFFDDTTMTWAASYIEGVLEEHGLRGTSVYFAGLSLGGTRALKIAQYLKEHEEEYWLRADAVAVVDAPLDMTRFWATEARAAKLEFHPAAADEGRWVTYLLRKNLGGNPDEAAESYRNYSVYTHGAQDGGRAVLLKNTPIRCYHEPDIDWWIKNRRKSYYDMNSIDMAALVTELLGQGNANVELVTTHHQRKEYVTGGSPHTWSFVDNADLVDWLVRMSQK